MFYVASKEIVVGLNQKSVSETTLLRLVGPPVAYAGLSQAIMQAGDSGIADG